MSFSYMSTQCAWVDERFGCSPVRLAVRSRIEGLEAATAGCGPYELASFAAAASVGRVAVPGAMLVPCSDFASGQPWLG